MRDAETDEIIPESIIESKHGERPSEDTGECQTQDLDGNTVTLMVIDGGEEKNADDEIRD